VRVSAADDGDQPRRARAVSDLVGFVLVFSLVVSVVAIVSVAGVGTLQDVRAAEQTNNAERAMEVLADNMGDIAHRGAPSRATEISLEDASVRLGDLTYIQIRDPDTGSDPAFLEDQVYRTRPIVYDDGNTELVYVLGAVFREDRRGGTIIEPWSGTFGEDRMLLPVTTVRSADDDAQQIQSSTVLVRASTTTRQVYTAQTDPGISYDHVWVNVSSSRPDLWDRMLSRKPSVSCTQNGPGWTNCSVGYEPEQLYVTETQVAVELGQ